MAAATVAGYAEYPPGSKKYWAIPLEGDANGWAYRKDWFEDPKEKEAFKAKYHYDLDVPKDYTQLRDIAEFFHRPNEKRYGVALYTDNTYDALAMGIEQTIFSFGGELGNYSSYKVRDIINSKQNVEALKWYRDLYKFAPPGWGKAFFLEDNQAITEGVAAMSMNFFAFFPALANPATNKNAAGTGFFANPAGPGGKPRFAALGGQGVSVVSYSKKREQALKFLEWFVRDDVQQRWAELGGYTCNEKVLSSEKFPQGHALRPRGRLLSEHVDGQGLLGHARVRDAARADEQARVSLRRGRQGHRRRSSQRSGRRLGENLQAEQAVLSHRPGQRGRFAFPAGSRRRRA